MRLAVISDIHGNIVALEAVLADLKTRGVDDIVNLGDCVTGLLWPRETLELLDTLKLPTVRGEHDRWLGEPATRHGSRSMAFMPSAFDAVDASVQFRFSKRYNMRRRRLSDARCGQTPDVRSKAQAAAARPQLDSRLWPSLCENPGR